MSTRPAAPHVSVILPTYNRADLLPRALHSVLSQDYTDLDLIVIDNGSSPETAAVLQQIDDPRLRRFRFEHNRGVGGARNEGVRQAGGTLIAFIDTDDVWLPGKLAYQVGLFQKYPDVELIFGNYRNINRRSGDDRSGFDQMRDSLQSLRVKELEAGVYQVLDGIPEAILGRSFFATPTVMVRASVFERVGNFNTNLSGPEDMELWYRSALRGVCFAYTTQLLIERCKDAESLSSKYLLFLPEYLKALDMCEDAARAAGRLDLLEHLNRSRGRTWRDMVYACALEGRRGEAWGAYRESLRHGFAADASVYLLAALGGPKAIGWAKRFGHRLQP